MLTTRARRIVGGPAEAGPDGLARAPTTPAPILTPSDDASAPPSRRPSLEELLPVAYDELRRIARQYLRRERPDHTLTTTALVHEAYLRLVEQTRSSITDRAHLLSVAALAMRRVLVDHARERNAVKRGAGQHPITLDDAVPSFQDDVDHVLSLDEALTKVESLWPRLARVVELRYFGGMSDDEVAEALGVTSRTVRRDWLKARAVLSSMLDETSA